MHPLHVSCDTELTAANKSWGDKCVVTLTM